MKLIGKNFQPVTHSPYWIGYFYRTWGTYF